MKRLIRGVLHRLGVDVVRYQRPDRPGQEFLPDISADDRTILQLIAGFSDTSYERQAALVQAVRYVVQRGIEGSFVECGVYRGGSSMAVAATLLQEKAEDRSLYLYDTFEGMTPPTDVDRDPDGTTALSHLEKDPDKSTDFWCVAGLDEVRRNMLSTGYPANRLHFVQGMVETTLPAQSPDGPIALLRLDTDWYESTRHEMVHLFPQLSEGGILMLDDYGHWAGARKAVDEYLATQSRRFYLHRIDYTGRLLIKL